MKKFIAAVMSLCIVGGAMPAVESSYSDTTIAANAEQEYYRYTQGYLTYFIYEDYAELYWCDINASGDIIIPSEVKGLPVTRIWADSFNNNCKTTVLSKVRSVTIPDTVKSIGNRAFLDCYELESISIPDSVESIGESVFLNCSKLEEITLPDSITSIGREAFANCSSLKSVVIPDSVTTISSGLFYRCESLESVKLPSSLEKIDDNAFEQCGIKSIEIPDTVKSIGSDAFCCSLLESITFPESVERLSIGALSNCTYLESVTIMNPDCKIIYLDDWQDVSGATYEYNLSGFKGTFYGHEGSTIQKYANEHGYKFALIGTQPTTAAPTTKTYYHLKGNANGDNEVNMSDVVMVMQACLNPKKYGVDGTSEDRIIAEGEKAADVDGKEGLSPNDALVIQRFTLHLIEEL